MVIQCKLCGEEFKIKRVGHVLCSARCAARNANRKRWAGHQRENKPCALCGETFDRDPRYDKAQWAKAQFCSRRCASKATGAQKAIPLPLCACGCGLPVRRHGRRFRAEHYKGTPPLRKPKPRPYEFFSRQNNRWYIATVGGGKVARYRVIAEQILGRPLHAGEVVHHINGDSTDDRPENLRVYPSNADHLRDAHSKR